MKDRLIATEMKERPMIFDGTMARAIIDGRKTQTRRPVKMCQQFEEWDATPNHAYDVVDCDNGTFSFLVAGDHGFTAPVACPYGQPGDLLWVRESFAMVDDRGIHIWTKPLVNAPANYAPVYRADHDARDARIAYTYGGWRPSSHMPRWASRITLEITAVRVERVQDISEADAMAEGCDGEWVWMVEFRRVEQ